MPPLQRVQPRSALLRAQSFRKRCKPCTNTSVPLQMHLWSIWGLMQSGIICRIPGLVHHVVLPSQGFLSRLLLLLQANEFAGLASQAATSELEQLTQQVAHLQALNGAATDKFNDMAEYGRGMSVFLEVNARPPTGDATLTLQSEVSGYPLT